MENKELIADILDYLSVDPTAWSFWNEIRYFTKDTKTPSHLKYLFDLGLIEKAHTNYGEKCRITEGGLIYYQNLK